MWSAAGQDSQTAAEWPAVRNFFEKVNKLRESTQPKLLYIDKELPSDPEVIYKSIVSRSVSEFGAMDVDT